MPGPKEVVASCRAKIFILPRDNSAPIPLALAEDLTISKAIAAENFQVIGSATPPDNVKNSEQGRVRWTKVHQVDPEFMGAITPRIRQWTEHQAFNLLVQDPITNEPIALCIGVQPEGVDLTFRGGVATRQNFTGICRQVLSDEEVTQAAAA